MTSVTNKIQQNYVFIDSLLCMFRATVSPIFRTTLTVYTAFWNSALQ